MADGWGASGADQRALSGRLVGAARRQNRCNKFARQGRLAAHHGALEGREFFNFSMAGMEDDWRASGDQFVRQIKR